MQLQVTLYTDDDGVWISECPAIPGCFSQGVTREAAMENIRDAIQGCLAVRAERGMPPTIETQQIEVPV